MPMLRNPNSLLVLGSALLAGGLFAVGKTGPFGRMPGDIMHNGAYVSVYAPLTSMLMASVVLSIVFWLLRR